MDSYRTYIHKSRYARFIDEKGRRENWDETVQRLIDFYCKKFPTHEAVLNNEIKTAILEMGVMPSMRSLMTAGPALEDDNICGYNCAYTPVDDIRCFSETLYILMNGTGMGFSVERQYIKSLPVVSETFRHSDSVIHVADSKIGWAQALHELISLLYQGMIPKWDVSKVRPAGARLKTFGGRASGPEPLVDLFKFTVNLFQQAAGRRLNSIECHDLMTMIGVAVVVGGVRRSAMISLSNLSDDRMRGAKMGNWWEQYGHRALANNSVAYTEKPDIGIFMKEWLSLYDSKSGERGIFNRVAAVKHAKATGRRITDGVDFATNPCAEILLRPNEFCNLTEVVIRADDTYETLAEKVKIATILGTFQSTLTDFRFIRSVWKANCDEERLLGVSLTGIMDHAVMSGASAPGLLIAWLIQLRRVAIDVNAEWAEKLGIPPSAAITTVKPSGTVSQLVDSASGIHPRYSPYYIRTVRQDKKDPLGQFLKDAGVPCEDDVTKPDATWVFSFPIKSPPTAVFRDNMSAIQQLEHYLIYKKHWTDHNVSITVYVRESEWLAVGAWVYAHFDDIGGVSFLPHSEHVYRQAPYQEVDQAQYEDLVSKMPAIAWETFVEDSDNVQGAKLFACTGDKCELV